MSERTTTTHVLNGSQPRAPRLLSIKDVFPTERLAPTDYAVGFALVAACSLLFFGGDIVYIGGNSLNFLFGNPLEFYENAHKYQGAWGAKWGAVYPPFVYAIFALWLLPLKFLGLITGPETLPPHFVYWLKFLTTITYFFTGRIFYLVALEYCPDKARAKYAAAAWLTMPLALFSQFIFSQMDVFYVLLTLTGFLMFLRERLRWASLCFGLAIGFKYFPAFVFIPLLLLFEKRPLRIAVCCLIFAAPMTIVRVIFSQSPTFSNDVIHYGLLERIYAAAITTEANGYTRIYLLLLVFAVLCGTAYFAEIDRGARIRVAAYVWLTTSIVPFLFIIWHPQWLMFPAPAIVLTSMIVPRTKAFLLLDLFSMALFIAAVSLIFRGGVDAAMFRADLLGVHFSNSYLMARLFDWFGDHSGNVFLTGFTSYLVLQITLKYRPLALVPTSEPAEVVDYDNIRQRLCVGLLIFLIPAFFSIYKDLMGNESFIRNYTYDEQHEILHGRSLEQTITSNGTAVKQISLLIGTFGRVDADELAVELVDASGKSLATTTKTISATHEFAWHEFEFRSIPVMANARYAVRLSSGRGAPGNAFLLLASRDSSYSGGAAILDGVAQDFDFAFEIRFSR